MPSGFHVHAVALLHVIIYTHAGQTLPQTITTETFGKGQDEQTYVPKRLMSVCFDRCAKEAKVSPCNLHLNPSFYRLAQNTQAQVYLAEVDVVTSALDVIMNVKHTRFCVRAKHQFNHKREALL